MNFPVRNPSICLGTSQLSRREVLCRIGGGFGGLGLATVLADAGLLAAEQPAGAVNPLAPKPPHFPAAGQAAHLPVHERRAVACRYLRPQAGADEARWQAACPNRSPRSGKREPKGNLLEVAVQDAHGRPERHRGQRTVSRSRPRASTTSASCARCTPTIRITSRACCMMNSGNMQPIRPEHGFVADLCPRHRQPEPARLRRALPRQAGRRPAAVEQQLPARHLSGHAHQQQDDRSRRRSSAM